MATSFSSFNTPIVCSSAPANPAKSDPSRRSTVQSSSWWTPLFGWSSQPDYISNSSSEPKGAVLYRSEKNLRGRLTEEKAKELRKRTIETSNFHDIMYHSAIASRLASDLSDH